MKSASGQIGPIWPAKTGEICRAVLFLLRWQSAVHWRYPIAKWFLLQWTFSRKATIIAPRYAHTEYQNLCLLKVLKKIISHFKQGSVIDRQRLQQIQSVGKENRQCLQDERERYVEIEGMGYRKFSFKINFTWKINDPTLLNFNRDFLFSAQLSWTTGFTGSSGGPFQGQPTVGREGRNQTLSYVFTC